MKSTYAENFKSVHGFYPIMGAEDPPPGAPITAAAGDPPPGAPLTAVVPPAAAAPGAPLTAVVPTDFAALVPAEYKDKPWVKETKDVLSLFKRTDDLITELGKRPSGIPQKNAKPDEIAAFRKAFGVPEKPEEYVFTDPPAELGAPNPKFQGAIKGMFHKHGVSADQAKGLQQDWDNLQLEMKREMENQEQIKDLDFDKVKIETFGTRAEDAIKGARLLIAKHAPDKFKTFLPQMDNQHLLIMAGVLDSIRKEYISEDRMPKDSGAAPVNMTDDERRKKGQELMASKAYQDPFDADHEKVKAEVQALYAKRK